MANEDTKQVHTHSGSFAGLHSHEGGPLHWHDEFGEHSAEELSAEDLALRELDWKMHHVELTTVGVDIGSSTSHLMFSRVYLQRIGEGAAARFVTVGRKILWKSPIILTPFVDEETIDALAVSEFITDAYKQAGAARDDVDSGAIILTGEALRRKNARAIADMFAADMGKFVCASAGHHLEAVLAANGSGTASRSRRDKQTLLNVDIGGGTTKLALVREGQVLATAAIAIGARLLVKDAERRLTRIDPPARRTAEQLGIPLALGERLAIGDEIRIVEAWTDILAGLIERRPLDELALDLMLTEPLPAEIVPEAVTFSGGVSEFIFFRESRDFGDLGAPLARALRQALATGLITLPAIIDPNLGIRATAIGASLFTVQVGNNAFVTDEAVLPLRNVPVLVPALDLAAEPEAGIITNAIRDAITRADLEEGEQPLALSFRWGDAQGEQAEDGGATESRVHALGEGICAAIPRTVERRIPFVVLSDRAISKQLGSALKQDLGVPGDLVALDGVAVAEFDFIDLAEMLHPAEAVPVSIKSLLFAGGLDRTSVQQALIAAVREQRQLQSTAPEAMQH